MDRRNFLKAAGAALAGAAVAVSPLSRSGIKAAEAVAQPPNIPDQDIYNARSVIMNYGKPNRNDDVFCYDMDCEPGEFTKKLVNLMKEVMKRQEAQPATHDLSQLYMSPEALEDIRNWGCDQIDEITRKEILSGDSEINHLTGVNISVSNQLEREELFELGRKGPYAKYVNFPVEVECNIEIPEERKVSNAIDWQLKYASEPRWDIVQRAHEILREGFEKKMKDDAWEPIKNAGI